MQLYGRVEERLVTNRETLISILCDSNGDHLFCDKCLKNGLCRVSEKTDQQIEYIFSSLEDSVFLKACPGSGKTEVVAMKAAYEISKWKLNGGIAILSFTNNAADVIHDRVSEFMGFENVSHPHFIGTFDSWLHGFIAHPFLHKLYSYSGNEDNDNDKSYRIIDEKEHPNVSKKNNKSKQFLQSYKLDISIVSFNKNKSDTLNKTPIWANNIRWEDEWELINPLATNTSFIPLTEYCSKEPFVVFKNNEQLTDCEIIKGITDKKSAFNKKGFATYNDVERLCIHLLRPKNNIISFLSKRFPLIIIDEAQDLSKLQLKTLQKLKEQGTNIHFVGDLQQAIYEFKKVDPDLVKKFVQDESMKTMNLTNNFRSNQNIVNLSQKIIPSTNDTKGNDNVESFPCAFVCYPKKDIAKLPIWFENHLTKLNDIDIKNAVILARGKGTISKLQPSATSGLKLPHEFALSIKLWTDGGEHGLKDAISMMGKFIAAKFFDEFSTTSNQFYKPSIVSKVSDWRSYISKVLNECIHIKDTTKLDKYWSEWAKLIKGVFPKIIHNNLEKLEFSENGFVFDQTTIFNFQSPSGDTNKKVIDTIKFTPVGSSSIQVKTIHSVKGQTLEAVMVVSSLSEGKGNKDGHWKEWLLDKHSEAARLAYVASSRPKKILVWAVPDVNETQKNRLIEFGFQQEKW
jgi:DNA helicase-2/ATP-dependent DNA helicase PcrA